MTKRKGHFQNKAQFISNLNIETCVRQLEQLQTDDVQIEFSDFSSDSVQFRIHGYEKGRLRVTVSGTLLRWEGTKTRVDCRLTIHNNILALTLLMLLIFVMLVGVFPALILLFSGIDSRLLLLLSAMFLLLIVGLLLLINRFAPPDDVPLNIMAMLESALY